MHDALDELLTAGFKSDAPVGPSRMKLYGYFRSSAAYRVRIALNLKGIPVEHAFIHLRRNEQSTADYKAMNPLELIPTLDHDGLFLTQSLAIIEYLEEIQPDPRLLPESAADRAYVRALAFSIACDIHPLNNLRVLKYLTQQLGVQDAGREAWFAHWISVGLGALEQVLGRETRVGVYCCGDRLSLAEVCLVPQVYSAERMKCDLSDMPIITRIVAAARRHPAFEAAAPEAQGDAE